MHVGLVSDMCQWLNWSSTYQRSHALRCRGSTNIFRIPLRASCAFRISFDFDLVAVISIHCLTLSRSFSLSRYLPLRSPPREILFSHPELGFVKHQLCFLFYSNATTTAKIKLKLKLKRNPIQCLDLLSFVNDSGEPSSWTDILYVYTLPVDF